MKKAFVYLTILVIGGILGFFANTFINSTSSVEPKVEIVKEIKEKVIVDTVIVKKKIPTVFAKDTTRLEENEEHIDSLIVENGDGMQEDNPIDFSDYISEEEDTAIYDIIRDELLSQRTVTLTFPPMDSTDVESLLDLKSQSFSEKMTIEFWKSPLNLTGYELTHNKLKLFGFNPTESFDLSLSQSGETLFLNTETMSIVLRKSDNFQTLNLK